MADPLQFESAEPASEQAARTLECASCKAQISGQYFEINRRLACAPCHDAVQTELKARKPSRFVLATVLGLGAGAVGAGLYYAVAAFSGYEFGLIGVVVGLLVGVAVRRGSGNRGGRPYQVLAAVITYVAIVSTYVPFLVKDLREKHAARPAATAPATTTAAPTAAGNTTPAIPAAAGTATPTSAASPNDASPQPAQRAASVSAERPTLLGGIAALFMVAGIILALPFLAGASNLMGLAIIGFSLYEAWKINRRAKLEIRGPFTVGGGV